MIHVLTVHWRNPDWIPIQADYLRRWTEEPYRTYAALDPSLQGHASAFDLHVTTDLPRHAPKLDLLARIACSTAAADDLLVFLDSDAFPVAPWVHVVEPQVRDLGLAAVRRDENDGAPVPHPCFCVTTPLLWRRLPGTWRRGPTWRSTRGHVLTDVGAVLMERLAQEGVEWSPLLRSNRVDRHPLFFAVYGGIVYHHGAGSRVKHNRVDAARALDEDAQEAGAVDAATLAAVQIPPKRLDSINQASDDLMLQMAADPGFFQQFLEEPLA